ncbi:DUF4489 domain-containing protein [Clostridium paridis]|uniref:DUF4489 domain-containing protein n=1 Tax=Clostridium paridis TaxID=2803863 RepID=A0A937FEX7_9CLOT|nr:DUF4489 domain-containing protein [Clostridium paridis]MBL4931943.1 DUF4489 domain-containing protein [Clostridium paridis]
MREYNCSEERGCSIKPPCPTGVILACGQGGYVDLSNMPTSGSTLASVSIDTTLLTRAIIKIDFSCILSYSVTVLEELDLIFTLVRTNTKGEIKELASWPYKILMDQIVSGAEEDQYVFITLEKNESFSIEYCDELLCGSSSTYSIRVNTNYFNITNAVIQSSTINAIAGPTHY